MGFGARGMERNGGAEDHATAHLDLLVWRVLLLLALQLRHSFLQHLHLRLGVSLQLQLRMADGGHLRRSNGALAVSSKEENCTTYG